VLIGDIGTRVHDEYHRSILVDYQAFITSFSAIFTLSLENTSGLFSDLYAPSKGSTLELLQPLRIGDLYQKLQYESFARKVYQTLVEHYGDTVSFLEAEEERQVRHIYVSHGMTRAMGMVSISYVLAEGLYLTVQIQGNSYRHMVQGYAGYGKESRVVAERLKAKGLWFRLSRVCEPSKEYPRGEKEFNTYSDIDFYRSGKVSPKATVEQVIEFVIHDMEQIAKQIRAISAALEV
jgi:hypothetical protein